MGQVAPPRFKTAPPFREVVPQKETQRAQYLCALCVLELPKWPGLLVVSVLGADDDAGEALGCAVGLCEGHGRADREV